MGAEIENSLESAIGVGLPPTSLMRARTVSQIAALIAGHMGGVSVQAPSSASSAVTSPPEEVDVDALERRDRQIARRTGRRPRGLEIDAERPQAMPKLKSLHV